MKPYKFNVQLWFSINTEFFSARYPPKQKKPRLYSSLLSVHLPFMFHKKKET